ncbi:MAG: hypothetical protein FWD06_07855 [Oscillospiraceae bacterium]|nr:hypothetical protein [Oscillospiraceae bacterium]
MKKLLALVLAMAMVLSFGIAATANTSNNLQQQGTDMFLGTYEALRTLDFSATLNVSGLLDLLNGETDEDADLGLLGMLDNVGDVHIAVSEGNVALSARVSWGGLLGEFIGDAWWARAISWVFDVLMNNNVRIVLHDTGRVFFVGRLFTFNVNTELFGLDIPGLLEGVTDMLPDIDSLLNIDFADPDEDLVETLANLLGMDAAEVLEGMDGLAELLADFLGVTVQEVIDDLATIALDALFDVQEVNGAVVVSLGTGDEAMAAFTYVDGVLVRVAFGDMDIAFGSFTPGVADNAFNVRGLRLGLDWLVNLVFNLVGRFA